MVNDSVGFTATVVEFDPFAGPEIARLVPTTEPQAEIWMACVLGGDDANRAYNESLSLRLNGRLDKAAMEQAVQALIRRHEALRAAFGADGRQMCVFRQRPIDVFYDDVSASAGTDRERFVDEYVRQEARQVFNLTEGPLLKVGLIKLADDEHHLTITAHHIVCDGWSFGIMMQDLSKLYSAYAQNIFPDLPAPALYSHYADEQLLFVNSDEYRQIEQFWLDQYRDGVPVVNLPTDYPRPVLRTFDGDRLDYALDPDLVLAIRKMGTKAGCSFVTTLLAAFEVLIHRLTGQDALVIGLPAAGQSATGHNRLVGHCVNLLPLKSNPDGDLSFTAFLKQRKGQLFDAYEHQRLTFGSLLRKLNIVRDTSRVPVVPVVFNIDMGLDDGVEFYGLTFRLLTNPKQYENFELFLNATGTGDSLTLEWAYNTSLFKAETMARLMDAFDGLLRFLVSNPEAKMADVPVDVSDVYRSLPTTGRPDKKGTSGVALHKQLSSSPAEEVRHQTAGGQVEFIDSLFDKLVQDNQDREAVVFRGKSISYDQLNRRADELSLLIRQQAGQDEIIGLSATRSLDMVVGMLAILKAGKAYLPLDPEYPAQRLEQIITDSGVSVCVVPAQELLFFQRLGLETLQAGKPADPSTVPVLRRQATACVLYTSGSTGIPKGVCLEHAGLINLVRWQQTHTTAKPGMKTLQFCHLSFDASFQEVFVPLLTGGTLYLVDDTYRLNATNLLDFIVEKSINRLFLPYVALQYLAETADTKNVFPGSLTEITTGGELLKITPQIARLFDELPDCTLMNVYGPTETSVWVTELKLKGNARQWPKIPTIGSPIAGLSVFLLDDDRALVPTGDVGELYISGVCLAGGYLNKPEQTAERFLTWTHPQQGPLRIYKTGDLARYLPNGELEFHGRKDNQVKIRGNRVELGEIEVRLNQENAVQQAVVIAREDQPGQKRLVAYLISATGEIDTLALKNRLETQLPDYMIPSAFVWLKALPQTPSGKVDRNALPEPDLMRPNISVPYRAPATVDERRIVAIWEELLKLERIGVDDNFFELGGHSLIAVQFMMQLERETGKNLPLSTLFEYSTINRLASLLTEKTQPGTLKSLVPIKTSGSKPPVYMIHGDGLNVLNFSGLAAYVDAEQPVYGLQAKGLDGISEAPDDMATIAADYVAEIVAQNPSGPYAIAGYSFGGYIGIEMARLLQEQGRQVKMLAMLDTNTENVEHHDGTMDKFSKRLARQVPKSAWFARSLLSHPLETLAYQLSYVQHKVRGAAKAMGWLKEQDPEGMFAIMKYVNEKHDVALANYHMKPYDGVIDLFRAKKRIYFVKDFNFLGWDRYALRGVRVHSIPGDHKSILLPPNDKAFARILQKALDESQP